MTVEVKDTADSMENDPEGKPEAAPSRLEIFKRRVGEILTKIAEPGPNETGWYIDSGEGRAYAAGAEVLKGADVSIGPDNRRFTTIIKAMKQVDVPPGSTVEQIMDTTTNKYLDLMAAEKGSDE
ncbi:hypothetical protein AB0L41_25665 [Amycolatopsis mediterranei]|uniref:hypothetical protein n=1 Tax=Amycolatopsis mediterranei TaxID=33910 RepID=UPI00343E4FA2